MLCGEASRLNLLVEDHRLTYLFTVLMTVVSVGGLGAGALFFLCTDPSIKGRTLWQPSG
jgi:hypothetical protein